MYGAGTVVAGKYRLERVLGQGGMGVVVAATHLQLGSEVALKILHSELIKSPGVIERFMREARASAALRGDNVCRVSDVGTLDDGVPFMVMELLNGHDFATILKANGAMPASNVVDIVMQICHALAEAHAAGIVHRDLKPGNLFWTQRPDGAACIKVLDFGVAKAPEDVNFDLTQTSSIIGSPGYMSPEQLKSSRGVDVRSDIWALGVVMFELVSGQKPFTGESITELALKVAMDPTPPLTGVVAAPFESVIRRCLEKDPARRFQDVAELAAALAPFAGPRGMEQAYGVARVLRGANTPIVPLAPAVTTPTTLREATGMISETVRPARRWKVPVIIGGGAAVGIALALLVVGVGQMKTSRKPAESTTNMSTTVSTGSASHEDAAKVEPAKVEAAKVEAAKVEAAKVEAAKADAAKAETKPDAAKEPTADAAKTEVGKLEAATAAKAEAAAKAKAAAIAKAENAKAAKAAAARAKADRAAKARAEQTKAKSNHSSTTSTTTKTTKPEDLLDSRL